MQKPMWIVIHDLLYVLCILFPENYRTVSKASIITKFLYFSHLRSFQGCWVAASPLFSLSSKIYLTALIYDTAQAPGACGETWVCLEVCECACISVWACLVHRGPPQLCSMLKHPTENLLWEFLKNLKRKNNVEDKLYGLTCHWKCH